MNTSTSRPTTPDSTQSHQSLKKRQPSSNGIPAPSSTYSSPLQASAGSNICAICTENITGQFVRALGQIYHLECFKCSDCGKVVAAKFFPVEGPNGQYPLCEVDYFRRLNLLCAKCGGALRGSYITALDAKFHVEHFTCSVCPTVFGPQDSYYEHSGSVYCHFHYSTRYAVKCTGCHSAILKQFVEINRYDNDEHWHPECYMINKFWNTKLSTGSAAIKAPSRKPSTDEEAPINLNGTSEDLHQPEASTSHLPPQSADMQPDYVQQESQETPESLKERQKQMEDKVYRIWTVLSTFEESSAACISEMLRFVSNSELMDGVKMLQRFILHVETLFAALDDLTAHFRIAKSKENAHVREARMLCKKTVNFFSLLSHSQDDSANKNGISQELLSLVTGLAHYLKILIRIALTSALRLEREIQNVVALKQFLNRLDRLARDSQQATAVPNLTSNLTSRNTLPSKTYGYKSLSRIGNSLATPEAITTDSCDHCRQTVEEECARTNSSKRRHLYCLRCNLCNRAAGRDKDAAAREQGSIPLETLLPVKEFGLESVTTDGGKKKRVWCYACAKEAGLDVPLETFDYVTRLEQYAFLLWIALNKLYSLLKHRGSLGPASIENSRRDSDTRSLYEVYRDSTDIKRMKSVNLDRKLSTTARMPKRSTVIESPSGRAGQFANGYPSRPDTRSTHSTLQKISSSPPRDRSSVPPRINQVQQPLSPGEKPPRPPPLVDPDRYSLNAGPNVPRPPVGRTLTAVKVIDEIPLDAPVARLDPSAFISSTDAEEGITLADLQTVIAVEQARSEANGSPARFSKGLLLSELSALEYIVVKHAAALALTSDNSPLRDLVPMEDLMELIEVRKNTFWNKIFKPGNDKKAVKKKGVFGMPLEYLVERGGVDSILGAGAATVRVPTFIDDVISAMKQMDMSVEGVFRKNGNIRRLKELSDALDKDPGSVNLVEDNPVQLAALLKKFLRELPDPLLTFKMHYLFISAQAIENAEQRKRMLHLILCLLPKAHRDTVEVLFLFLKWVASFSHIDEESGSKMDLANLATVICPNILYAKGRDPNKDESFKAIRAVSEILDHQDTFWQVPPEIAPIVERVELFNTPELTSKDILRYCREVQNRQPLTSQQSLNHIEKIPSFHLGAPPPLSIDLSNRSYSAQERPMSSTSWQNISPTGLPSP